MLHFFLAPLAEDIQLFNVFRYITFRTGGAIMTALLIGMIFGAPLINWLKLKQGKGQPIRDFMGENHIVGKRGTPTMGGFLILLSMFVATLLWADLTNRYVWIVLGVTAVYGVLGFYDDYKKVTKQKADGISARAKLVVQIGTALAAAWAVMAMHPEPLAGMLAVPFFKDLLVPLSFGFIVFGCLVIAFISNAVNLTDGLDGLAIVPVMVAAACFGIISYLVGNVVFAEYLQVHHVPGTGELAVVCGAMIGAGLAFLWFNAPPAQVFMGDTGSLALGGTIATMAVATKHEIVLGIIGGLFVLEAVSVMVQVASFKLTGKRVFRMAPIHHHFEKLGWAEPTIVIRFWIIAVILALVGLSTLKLR
jgi:phospho-N-acetylmuramoyl-pentapeptide-transferase